MVVHQERLPGLDRVEDEQEIVGPADGELCHGLTEVLEDEVRPQLHHVNSAKFVRSEKSRGIDHANVDQRQRSVDKNICGGSTNLSSTPFRAFEQVEDKIWLRILVNVSHITSLNFLLFQKVHDGPESLQVEGLVGNQDLEENQGNLSRRHACWEDAQRLLNLGRILKREETKASTGRPSSIMFRDPGIYGAQLNENR